MDFTIVYCVTLTSYDKALYLHFYYLTIWTHCTCMHVLSEINYYYYYYTFGLADIGMLNVCDSLRDNSIRNRNVHFDRVFYVIDGYIYIF